MVGSLFYPAQYRALGGQEKGLQARDNDDVDDITPSPATRTEALQGGVMGGGRGAKGRGHGSLIGVIGDVALAASRRPATRVGWRAHVATAA